MFHLSAVQLGVEFGVFFSCWSFVSSDLKFVDSGLGEVEFGCDFSGDIEIPAVGEFVACSGKMINGERGGSFRLSDCGGF